MVMNRTSIALLLGTVTVFLGCKNESATSAVASASATPEPAAMVVAQIPVKEDFEEQAKAAVTAANLDDQLDELEKQISK
jgi:hypothetical protein